MDISELVSLPIIDCHCHIRDRFDAIDSMLHDERAAGIDQINIVVTSFPGRPNLNPQGLYAKAKYPHDVFLFPGLDYSALAGNIDPRLTYPLADQVNRFAALGADGVKMLNGKPNYRKASGIALDSVIYEHYFARIEETGVPVLWHVNDPEEFWNPEEAPEWAKGPGWLYDDTFPSKESIYQECDRVLNRHPNLNIIFAHFYFLSDDLPRAAEFLDSHPNVNFDLAPGIEMLHNFTKGLEAAREFFLKYQDRICFGTDFSPGGRPSRLWVVRNFLESDEEFHVPTDEVLFWPDHRNTIRGIALSQDALRKIYADNFRRIVSSKPRPLDRSRVIEELHRLAMVYDQMGTSRNSAREAAMRITQELDE